MNEIELIAEILKQTFYGRAWHGPSFLDALDGVDKNSAIKRPIKGGHTIWEIVDHCSYWMEAVTKALHVNKMPDVKSTEDWQKMGETSEDWTKSQEKLKAACQKLIDSLNYLTEDQMTQKIQGSYNGQSYNIAYRRMLHGISHHNTYHAGQISILRRRQTS